MTQYLLIGNGRIATHFREYLRHLRLDFETWSRKENQETELLPALGRAHRVLLMISDRALSEFYGRYGEYGRQAVWIHFSGALEIEGVQSFHPLMTFGRSLYDLATYNTIPFVSTSRIGFAEAFPGLTNRCFSIPVAAKPRYHAMCVLSGNFTTLLWQKMLSELDQWNLPSDIALPYAQKTIEMVFRNPDEALSGPFIRGDLETQKKNLAALSEDPYHDVYRAFQQAYMQKGPK